MPYATVTAAGTAANGTAITAQGSDYHINIDAVYVSADASTEVTLHTAGASGTSDIYKQYAAANGGQVNSFRSLLQTSNKNDEIQYSTDSASGNVFIALKWHHDETAR